MAPVTLREIEWWRGMMALRWTVGKWAIEKSAIDKAGSQGLIRPMTDFHGVFPYPVSLIDASAK